MKIFKIKENVFNTEPIIISNCSYDELCKYLKKKYKIELERSDEDIVTNGQQFNFIDKKLQCSLRIVYVKNLNRSAESLGVLVHELLHLVVRVLDDKYVPFKKTLEGQIGDETGAYLLESYVIQVIKRI